jgi:hypothetical protein
VLKVSVKLNLKGFEKMLEEIQAAGGNVEAAAKDTLDECAKVVEDELKSACNAAGVPSSVSSEIGIQTGTSGNRLFAKVGWEMGNYDPKNLSAGFKAVFMNYGTIRRQVKDTGEHAPVGGNWKTLGTDRGAVTGTGFIAQAKEASAPKVKKIQKQKLNEILKGLRG